MDSLTGHYVFSGIKLKFETRIDKTRYFVENKEVNHWQIKTEGKKRVLTIIEKDIN